MERNLPGFAAFIEKQLNVFFYESVSENFINTRSFISILMQHVLDQVAQIITVHVRHFWHL